MNLTVILEAGEETGRCFLQKHQHAFNCHLPDSHWCCSCKATSRDERRRQLHNGGNHPRVRVIRICQEIALVLIQDFAIPRFWFSGAAKTSPWTASFWSRPLKSHNIFFFCMNKNGGSILWQGREQKLNWTNATQSDDSFKSIPQPSLNLRDSEIHFYLDKYISLPRSHDLEDRAINTCDCAPVTASSRFKSSWSRLVKKPRQCGTYFSWILVWFLGY